MFGTDDNDNLHLAVCVNKLGDGLTESILSQAHDQERTYFSVVFIVHEAFTEEGEKKYIETNKAIVDNVDVIDRKQNVIDNNGDVIDSVIDREQNVIDNNNDVIDLSDIILQAIREDKHISIAEIARRTEKSSRTISRYIRKLQDDSIIERVGADFGGYWHLINEE
jgi:predicted HTH transcriptional regulator